MDRSQGQGYRRLTAVIEGRELASIFDRDRCRHKASDRQEFAEEYMEQAIINHTKRIKA